VKKNIISDCYRYYGDITLKSRIKTHLVQASYRYTKLYRKANFHKRNGNKIRHLYYKIRLLKSSYKYGYQINENATIGYGLYLGHRGTIIVNKDAVLGNNVNLQAGVTIGQENRGKRIGAPTIGNKVWIGGNAVVVGNITIGDNVLIAPNAYVNFDVPSDSIVIGNPAKIMHNADATKGYIQNAYTMR
jgi:serine O-acetyltransferase